jgi:hypothetical protein
MYFQPPGCKLIPQLSSQQYRRNPYSVLTNSACQTLEQLYYPLPLPFYIFSIFCVVRLFSALLLCFGPSIFLNCIGGLREESPLLYCQNPNSTLRRHKYLYISIKTSISTKYSLQTTSPHIIEGQRSGPLPWASPESSVKFWHGLGAWAGNWSIWAI